nr:retrovirus-related Pol polyprotein from transposon TNT 1-94 [Tanacetum cinerariifolium]
MSRDVITVGSTMRIPLLYRGEYSQWRERFMNYLEEQTDNSIQNGDHLLPVVTQVSLVGTTSNVPPPLKDKSMHMLGSEYGEQDRKALVLYEYETFKTTEGKLLLDTYIRYLQVINDLKKCGYKKDNCELNFKFLNHLQLEWKQYGTMMRQNKNLMDINIDALYNILKQNQGDVNDSIGYKKKVIVVTSDPLALVTEKTKVSKHKEKVVVQSESEGSADEHINDLKKITALLAKAFNQKKYYAKPTNNNLRTSSASSSANKKPEYVKSKEKKEDKKSDEEKRDMNKVNSDSDQEINANMVFMAKIKKVLSDSEESSSSAEETFAEVSYYRPDSESESEYDTSEYYVNSTNYGLFVDSDDDQEIFHDAIEFASENFNENHIVYKTDHDQSEVDHNDSKEKDHLVDKLIEFNQKIVKCQKRIEKTNQQSKDLEDQNKELQDKYDVLKNQLNTFEEKNNEFHEQIKFLITVRFGNTDFVVIAGYGDVVIGSMTIKKVYYVEDLLTGDRSSNLYTIALNEIASNASACLLAKASSSQSWLWHQRLSHLNFATINNLVKNNLVRGLPKMKFKKDHLCSACEQGKIHQNYHKSKMAFASNKPLYLLHMDLCGPLCIESINEKRYVLVVVDDYSRYTWQNGVVERKNRTLVEATRTMLTFANLLLFLWAEAIAAACFTQNRSIIHKHFDKTPYELINKRKPNIKFFYVFGYRCYLLNDYDDVGKLKEKKDIGVFVGYSKESATFSVYNKYTRKIHESVNVNFDEISEMTSKQFSLEPANVETSNNEISSHEEVFQESSESFQEESSSSSLNDDVQQSLKETKDHPLYKIISDPKSSVRTRGQLANSCLFSCLLSSIEPDNVAEALKDADWVSAMQDELDQFARFKVWRLVPQPEGKTIIKTKWIFKNKKDESIARIEAIRLFLAYAAHKDFTVFQMDVNMAFLNGILKKEVNVGQPPGFVIKQYPHHVHALDKALCGLKQAPRAWYDVLSKFLIDSELMVKRSEMSMMEEIKFFLGLQVNQFSNRIFINQSKYTLDILKRFRMENCNTVSTPMVEQAKLQLDLVEKLVDNTDYRSMIGSLMYLTLRSEYIVVSGCCAQVLWMRTQLTDYGFFDDKVPISCDSKSAIAISCNPVQHTRTKHIDVSFIHEISAEA